MQFKICWALAIFTDSDFQIHLRSDTTSRFVDNYNAILLKSWRENAELQPVTNYYKAVAYMAIYFLKSDQKTSEGFAEREITIQKLQTREAMYKIAHALQMHANFKFRKQHTYVYQSYG